MQIIHSLKVYLAVFFAMLYLLSPLNEEILEISHSLAHKIEQTSAKHHHSHSHSHSESHAHPHPHKETKHSDHSVAHEHEVLEFINSMLEMPEDKKDPIEKHKKDTYDKHLVQQASEIYKYAERQPQNKFTYILRSYSNHLDIQPPPPEIS